MVQMIDRRKLLAFSLLLIAAAQVWLRSAAARNLTQASAEHSQSSWLSSSQQADIDQLFARPPASPGYAVAVIKDGEFALWPEGMVLRIWTMAFRLRQRLLFISHLCPSSLLVLRLRY